MPAAIRNTPYFVEWLTCNIVGIVSIRRGNRDRMLLRNDKSLLEVSGIMRKIDWLVLPVVLVGLTALIALPGKADEVKKADAAKVAELIKQLGSENFDDRESATKALDAIGEPALEALKKAAKSDDAETQKRADELVRNITRRLDTTRLLTPTKVKLEFKDTPVKEALEELSKKSKYQIVLHDPHNKVGDRKVTLETKELIFWEAFDKLCKEANLVEASVEDLMAQPNPNPGGPGKPVPPQTVPPIPNAVPPGQQFGFQAQAQPAQEEQERAAREKAQADAQARQAQAQPAQPGQPAGPVNGRIRPQPIQGGFAPDAIIVVDGKPVDHPTYYSGAIRFRGLPADPNLVGKPQEGEQMFILEITPEPKLQWQGMTTLQIEKAIDDLDQKLAQVTVEENQLQQQLAPGVRLAKPIPGFRRAAMLSMKQQVPVRLKSGEKDSKTLKEVNGVATLEVRTPPEAMITVDNILKAGGTTVKGDNGGSIKVIEASKDDDKGTVKVRVELDYPQEIWPAGQNGGIGWGGGGIIINPGGPIKRVPAPPIQPAPAPQQGGGQNFQVQVQVQQVQVFQVQAQGGVAKAIPGVAMGRGVGGADGLTLVDEKGNTLTPNVTGMGIQAGPGGIIRDITMEFKLDKDAPAPAKLVFYGTKGATLDVPFNLKDVQLKK